MHLHWLIWITSWVDETLHSFSTILAASKNNRLQWKTNFPVHLHKSQESVQNIDNQDKSLCARLKILKGAKSPSILTCLCLQHTMFLFSEVAFNRLSHFFVVGTSVPVAGRVSAAQRADLLPDSQDLCPPPTHHPSLDGRGSLWSGEGWAQRNRRTQPGSVTQQLNSPSASIHPASASAASAAASQSSSVPLPCPPSCWQQLLLQTPVSQQLFSRNWSKPLLVHHIFNFQG